jgi:tetratricopeptide (TPR) repeat protein
MDRWNGRLQVALALGLMVLLLLATPSRVNAGPFEDAVKAFEADDFPKAEGLLAAVLKKSPDDTRARLLLGWTVWSQGRYDESLLLFKKVRHEAPSHRIPRPEEYDAFNIPREVAYIENPDLLQARKGLGWTYYKKGWPRSALVQFEFLVGKAPKWDEPYLGRGYAHLALGQLDRAEQDFKEYAALARTKRDAERALGDLRAARGQMDRAMPHYERALKLKPTWLEVQSDLAWTYVAVGRHADAEKLFAALKPARPLEWETGMARISLDRGKFDEVEAALGRVLAASPYYGRALQVQKLLREKRYGEFDAAWALYYQGKWKEAVAAFEALLKQPGHLPPSLKFSLHSGVGWARLALKEAGAAEAAFHESLKELPGGAEATAGLGWVALQRKDWAAAEKAFTEAVTVVPGLVVAHEGFRALRQARLGAFDEAWALYYSGKATEALKAFQRLQAPDGQTPSTTTPYVRAGVAWAELEVGRLDEAEKIFDELSKQQADVGAEGTAGLGWVALKRGQPEVARARFQEALAAVPGHAAAQRGLAALRRLEVPQLNAAWEAYYAGKFAAAAETFREAAGKARLKAEYRAEAARGLAWSLLRGGKAAEAARAFETLVAASPDADALYGRGLALSEAGRYADALEPLKRAAALAPLSADILLAQGWALLKGGDAKGAEAAFLKAYALAPASAEVNRSIAWALARQNRAAEAMPAFRYALLNAPGATDDADFRQLVRGKEYRDLRRDLAWAYVQWNAFERARPIFEELVREDAGDGDGQFGLGYTLYKAGRHTEADAALERAVRAKRRAHARTVWVVFPDRGAYPILTDARSIRGWNALARKDLPAAVERFKESADLDPELVSSLAGLGLALQRSGDRNGAREAYLRASEIYPTYPVVVTGLRETGPAATAQKGDR